MSDPRLLGGLQLVSGERFTVDGIEQAHITPLNYPGRIVCESDTAVAAELLRDHLLGLQTIAVGRQSASEIKTLKRQRDFLLLAVSTLRDRITEMEATVRETAGDITKQKEDADRFCADVKNRITELREFQ